MNVYVHEYEKIETRTRRRFPLHALVLAGVELGRPHVDRARVIEGGQWDLERRALRWLRGGWRGSRGGGRSSCPWRHKRRSRNRTGRTRSEVRLPWS